MIRLFLAWWFRQLAGLLPARWRAGAKAADADDAVLIALADPASESSGHAAVDVARRRRGRYLRLGRFGLDEGGLVALRAAIGAGRHGPVRLMLPPAYVLEQPVALPLQAERGLETALRWEMDRLTPFAADAVFWTWRITERDRARGQLQLRLLLVAKTAVSEVIDTLSSAGLRPARLETIGDPARAIPLIGPRAGSRPTGLALALAACAVLAMAAIAIPFIRQQSELDRLGAGIAESRPLVDVAEAMRRRIAERAASVDVLAAEAARVGNALRILAMLTDILPDDTSLTEFSLRDRVVAFSGQSNQASKLIPALAADPAISNPVFSAPVTRNEMTRAEAFTIRAEIRP